MSSSPISYVCHTDEQFERIQLAFFPDASLDISPDLTLPLLSIARECELLFVAPEHARPTCSRLGVRI